MKSVLAALIFLNSFAFAQTISTHVPGKFGKKDKFLFYLHGGVVTRFGNNAINSAVPEWGPYEYFNILDSLRSRGFHAISENRKEGIENSVYISKISQQIDTLLKAGINSDQILVLGASAGWEIALGVSSNLKNNELKFVIMGGCWPDTYKEFLDIDLYGHFLSVIEATDPHGTCYRIFEGRKFVKSYQEIKLNMGLSHGFIYKGYKEWINPIEEWFAKTK